MAFNVLLAGIPFFLLLAAGLGVILQQSPDTAALVVQGALRTLFPGGLTAEGSILDPVLRDVVRTRTVVGLWGALAFLWFSSRLFGTLRAVLSFIFVHGRDRGYFHGKLVDFHLILVSVLLMTGWVTVSARLAVTSGRIGARLAAAGVLEQVASGFEAALLRAFGVAIVVLIFFSLYRWLPRARTPWRPALIGAAAAAGLFELAHSLFAGVVLQYQPTSLYTGTLGAIFIVIFWTYYAALIFVIGAEVAHVVEMRMVASGRLEPRTPLADEFHTTRDARASGAIDIGLPTLPPDRT